MPYGTLDQSWRHDLPDWKFGMPVILSAGDFTGRQAPLDVRYSLVELTLGPRTVTVQEWGFNHTVVDVVFHLFQAWSDLDEVARAAKIARSAVDEQIWIKYRNPVPAPKSWSSRKETPVVPVGIPDFLPRAWARGQRQRQAFESLVGQEIIDRALDTTNANRRTQ